MTVTEHKFDNLRDLDGNVLVVAAEYTNEQELYDHLKQIERAGKRGAEFGQRCKDMLRQDSTSS